MEEKAISDEFWDVLIEEDERARNGGGKEDARPDVDSPEFQQAYDELMLVMNNKPIQRWALWRILEFCRTPQPVERVEEVIAEYPEFPLIMQPPYRLVKFLIQGGGLVQYEIDANGNVIEDERKSKLDRDQIDDLIESYRLETTAVGRKVVDDMAPFVLLKEMFQRYADRAPLYLDVLEFCKTGRTYADVEAFITPDRIEGLTTYNYEPGVMMLPSVFLDNMERAGGIVWYDHAWHTTEEGDRVLKAIAS